MRIKIITKYTNSSDFSLNNSFTTFLLSRSIEFSPYSKNNVEII